MNSDEYKKMYELEDLYWWFVGRRKLVKWLLKEHNPHGKESRLFDLGCGTGLNLSTLVNDYKTFGSDSSQQALAFCRERNLDGLFTCSADAIALSDESVDVVTALDVLEHVRDDLPALREINRILTPGGKLIVTVPAYGFLWSEHDEALHHYRRYVARELRAKLIASNFEIERSTYFITGLFFPILFFRLWQGLRRTSIQASVSYRMPPSWINRMLVWTLDVERYLLNQVNLPFGVSLVIVGRKPAEQRLTTIEAPS
jgi:SAM-dependent methyltransferase